MAGASPDPGSIPWLLLTATDKTEGAIKNIATVQRLATKGGKAPETGCEPSRKDEQRRIRYTATTPSTNRAGNLPAHASMTAPQYDCLPYAEEQVWRRAVRSSANLRRFWGTRTVLSKL